MAPIFFGALLCCAVLCCGSGFCGAWFLVMDPHDGVPAAKKVCHRNRTTSCVGRERKVATSSRLVPLWQFLGLEEPTSSIPIQHPHLHLAHPPDTSAASRLPWSVAPQTCPCPVLPRNKQPFRIQMEPPSPPPVFLGPTRKRRGLSSLGLPRRDTQESWTR